MLELSRSSDSVVRAALRGQRIPRSVALRGSIAHSRGELVGRLVLAIAMRRRGRHPVYSKLRVAWPCELRIQLGVVHDVATVQVDGPARTTERARLSALGPANSSDRLL